MKIFEKFVLRKKNLNETEKFFLKNQFFANFSKQIVFFYVKFAFRMFSAFIWYTYCPCRSKMTNFQKLWYRKLENFRSQSRLLQRHLTAKLCNLEWCSKTLEVGKDASFHLESCLVDLDANCHISSDIGKLLWFSISQLASWKMLESPRITECS